MPAGTHRRDAWRGRTGEASRLDNVRETPGDSPNPLRHASGMPYFPSMEFTVFTTAGGFREFPGDSSYTIGENNAVLYVFEGNTGQVVIYGPNAWASVQEWMREGQQEAGRRKLTAEHQNGHHPPQQAGNEFENGFGDDPDDPPWHMPSQEPLSRS